VCAHATRTRARAPARFATFAGKGTPGDRPRHRAHARAARATNPRAHERRRARPRETRHTRNTHGRPSLTHASMRQLERPQARQASDHWPESRIAKPYPGTHGVANRHPPAPGAQTPTPPPSRSRRRHELSLEEQASRTRVREREGARIARNRFPMRFPPSHPVSGAPGVPALGSPPSHTQSVLPRLATPQGPLPRPKPRFRSPRPYTPPLCIRTGWQGFLLRRCQRARPEGHRRGSRQHGPT
jgi:hypothetical protein